MGAFDFIKSLFGAKKEENPGTAAAELQQPAASKPEHVPEVKAETEEKEAPALSQPISTGGGYGRPFAQVVREAEAREQEKAPGVDIKESPSALVPLQRGEKFLQELFATMDIKVQILRREDEEGGTIYELVGERLGILIGKHGQTLDAIQYLANLAANKDHADGHARIVIDIEGYRSRREETLMRLAGHLAEKACRIGQEVHLEPMNRHERKIIHTALQDNHKVSTYSAGEEPRRYVVIVPKKRKRRYGREDY